MKLLNTDISGLIQVELEPHIDNRGMFKRSFCKKTFRKAGISFDPVQSNISENKKQHTLRGFHYRVGKNNEAKLIVPILGEIYNVVIDLRRNSKTFLSYFSVNISASQNQCLLVPEGCANAFLTLQQNTIIHYQMGDYFEPGSYRGFKFNDPFFKLQWPHEPDVVSVQDLNYPSFDPETDLD